MKKRLLSFGVVIVILVSSVLLISCKSDIIKYSKNLSEYNISASYDEFTDTISAKQKIVFVNNYNVPLNSLKLHLYPNAYREVATIKPITANYTEKAYPNGASWGDIMVGEVQVGGKTTGSMVEGEDRNILSVEFPMDLYPKAKFTIEFDFVLRLANVEHRLGVTDKTVNLGNWFPIACVYEDGEFVTDPYYPNGDPFYSEVANYDIDITLNSDYVVAATGRCIGTELKGNSKKLMFEAKAVRDFAFVFSKDFTTITRTVGDTVLHYYYYDDQNAEQSIQIAQDALITYNDMIGIYPYPILSVVQTPFLFGGMEYPALVYIADDMTKYEQYQETIVHEIVHQWWYAVVGNNQVKYPWLDEGLTGYTTTLFYEKNPQYEISKSDRMIQLTHAYLVFIDFFENIHGTVDTSMTRASNEYTTEYEYVYMSYVKGELMFDSMRNIIGDVKFFNGLRRYYADNKFKVVTPEHLIGAFEDAAGADLDNVFYPWLEGKIVLGSDSSPAPEADTDQSTNLWIPHMAKLG